jgi:hypothetical protein
VRGYDERENDVYGVWFDDGAKGFVVVDVVFLRKNVDYPPSLVAS